MKHALVIGGTGMLADVSLWLVEKGYHVSVIARNSDRMQKLMKRAQAKECFTPLVLDYTNENMLKEKLKDTIKQNGNIDLVVAWIHSYAKDALSLITNVVSEGKNYWELFHVLGSSSNLEEIKRKAPIPSQCVYYQVQLGFIIEGEHSRWLTHQEISEGVIEAIKKKKKVHIVGQLEPWEKRP